MKRSRLYQRVKQIITGLLAILLMIVMAMLYGIYIEPNWFEVKEVSLQLPHLSPAFNGYRIVQITDLHVDRYFKLANLQVIAHKINDQHPDLVVLTGDYVSKGNVEEAVGEIADNFRQILAPDGILAVLGNHDYWTDAAAVTRNITKYQIKLLKNQTFMIHRGQAELAIAGLDDAWVGQPDLAAILKELGQRSGAILLAHEPDIADETAATHQFDLQLSGHSHGGQIRLPYTDWVLPFLGKKYPLGQYQVQDMIQYTNRGIGMGGIPMRFNCRPEITSFVLHSR
jgi:uncharacterized protein